jgi:hypothetical protein
LRLAAGGHHVSVEAVGEGARWPEGGGLGGGGVGPRTGCPERAADACYAEKISTIRGSA